MGMRLIGYFEIHLDNDIAIDDHPHYPKGPSLPFWVKCSCLKAVSNKYHHKERPTWRLQNVSPEGSSVEKFILLTYIFVISARIFH